MKTDKELNEISRIKEEAYIEQLGYSPTWSISDHEWEAQLNRLKQSDEMEKKHESKSK